VENYIMHPSSVKGLAAEITKACNDYHARQLSEQELKRVIRHWANSYGAMLFAGPDCFNPTIVKVIGAKRLRLMETMLGGFQTSMM